MRRMVILMLLFFLVGCVSTEGYISAKTVESNYEAVAVPFLRYMEEDDEIPVGIKKIHRRGVERFRELIEKAKGEVEDDAE